MATTTKTVTYFSCDLCGTDHDEDDLVRLYGPLQSGRRVQVDVCLSCRERPIAELIG